ncbi:MAG: hypothetical protein GXY36_11060 [Chloroflexi bacterium]|nr:hypothetical protein [Chloroflexota bacterium]
MTHDSISGQLPMPDDSGSVILISGWRQAGKTTLLLDLRAAAREAGLRVGGFLSPGRFVQGVKTGIDLLDAASGATIPLATVGEQGAIHTGRYSFEAAAFEAGIRYAEAGQTADVFLMDELGPLELVRGEGWAAVIPLLRARRFGVALVVVRPDLIDAAREQIGLPPDSPLIRVDESNRDDVRDRLVGWLRGRVPRG